MKPELHTAAGTSKHVDEEESRSGIEKAPWSQTRLASGVEGSVEDSGHFWPQALHMQRPPCVRQLVRSLLSNAGGEGFVLPSDVGVTPAPYSEGTRRELLVPLATAPRTCPSWSSRFPDLQQRL